MKENNRYYKPKTHKRSTALGIFKNSPSQAACQMRSNVLVDSWDDVTCRLCLKMKETVKVKSEVK